MAGHDPSSQDPATPFRRILVSGLSLLRNRIELATVELNEEKLRLLEVLLLGAVAVFMGMLALLTLTAMVVVLLWAMRPWPLVVFSALYTGLTVTACLLAKRRIRQWPPSFSATMAELEKDRECLSSRP